MAEKYTEAQKRASIKYQKERAQIKITIPKEQRERWQKHAAQKGISMTELITELIENNIKK